MTREPFGFRVGGARPAAGPLRVLVVGAGIGGLVTAHALATEGHAVTLAEQAPGFEAVGAGIVLGPQALAILAALGIPVTGLGEPLSAFAIRTADGRPLNASLTEGHLAELGPARAMTRPALHERLAAALPDDVELRLGARLEPTELQRSDSYDLIVAADGLHSSFRRLVAPRVRLRYSGQTCWRGLAAGHWGQEAVEFWGDGVRFGVVQVAPDVVYHYLVVSAAAGAPAPAWPDGFARLVAGFPAEARRFITEGGGAPALHHDLLEVERPVWGTDRIILLGDAAHAMTPNQGQGAAMAIEDAAALVLALRVDPARPLERYRALRHHRVRRMQLASRRLGEAGHWPAPLRAPRNWLLRAIPDRLTRAMLRSELAPGFDLARLVAGDAT